MFDVGSVSVRRARVADAGGIVALGRRLDPNQLATPDTFRALLEAAAPTTTERLVAEQGGTIVGWAPSGLYSSGRGWFWIGVHPEARGRGVGGAIYRHLEARLRAAGAGQIETTPNDEEGREFLTRRGFAVSASVRVSELDPRLPLPAAPAHPGRAVVPLREALDRPEALFGLYAEGRADVPSETARAEWSYAEWRAETLDHPLLDLDASVVVLENAQPVSLAWLYTDREGHRAETLMAATRRDRRGLGLATLAKIESTRRAADLGITRILTGNDVANAPMLAINERLGYTPTVVIESYAKTLGRQRGVILVEGTSDRHAVETLARRRGRDLQAEGIAVVAMGGYGNLPRVLERYTDVPLAGLYDAGEERHFLRALGCGDRDALEQAGFYACTRDLEDELTRAVGPDGMERVLAEQGELRAFRTYQRQPAHRSRPLEEQLHGFMWNRKQRYAVLLVEALELDRVPRPLDRVLAHFRLADGARLQEDPDRHDGRGGEDGPEDPVAARQEQ